MKDGEKKSEKNETIKFKKKKEKKIQSLQERERLDFEFYITETKTVCPK